MNPNTPSRAPSPMDPRGQPTPPPDSDPADPATLADAIRRAQYSAPDPATLSHLDDAVLSMAAQRIGRRPSTAAILRRIGLPLAAAAGLALAVWAVWPQRVSSPVASPRIAATFDPAKPGGVTILDAFTLAKLLKSQQQQSAPSSPVSPTWDINGDGVVDDRDVESLAQRAVQLSAANTRSGSGGPS